MQTKWIKYNKRKQKSSSAISTYFTHNTYVDHKRFAITFKGREWWIVYIPIIWRYSGPCNNFYCLGHFKNVYDDDDDDDDDDERNPVVAAQKSLTHLRSRSSFRAVVVSAFDGGRAWSRCIGIGQRHVPWIVPRTTSWHSCLQLGNTICTQLTRESPRLEPLSQATRSARNKKHTRLTALCPGLPGWAGTRKVKPIWILLKQETISGSGISWTICKSAPQSRQITTPAPHRSVFYRLDALPAAQPTASKHWRHCTQRKASASN